ncbi:unnamed protein product [Urochloa humidicola]
MEFQPAPAGIVDMISDALSNAEKLPAALISSGIGQAAAALALTIFKGPEGIFLHHGKAPLYYGILVAVMIFGFVEASAGIWVSRELTNRRAAGKTILWISILPLVLATGLGGFVILK